MMMTMTPSLRETVMINLKQEEGNSEEDVKKYFITHSNHIYIELK
jgi:hypothetical protein